MRTDWSSTTYLIHQVVLKGNLELLKVFCEVGADVEKLKTDWMQNERGAARDDSFSVLYLALNQLFKSNNEDFYAIAEYLGEQGASINTKSHYLHEFPNPRFE